MRSRVRSISLLMASFAACAALLGTPAAAYAACPSDAGCVTYSPSSGAPGTLVTIRRSSAGHLPVIQSSDCAPGARVNADFIRGGVVVALSELKGDQNRASFRVPGTSPGTYRIDLYCPDGNTAVTLAPNFQVLPPETSTDAVLPPAPGDATPLVGAIGATFALAFALVLLAIPRTRFGHRAAAAMLVRHVPFTGPGSVGAHPLFGREARPLSPRPHSSVRTRRLRSP